MSYVVRSVQVPSLGHLDSFSQSADLRVNRVALLDILCADTPQIRQRHGECLDKFTFFELWLWILIASITRVDCHVYHFEISIAKARVCLVSEKRSPSLT